MVEQSNLHAQQTGREHCKLSEIWVVKIKC